MELTVAGVRGRSFWRFGPQELCGSNYPPYLVAPLLALAANRRLPARAWWLALAFAFPMFSGTLFTNPSVLGLTLGSIYSRGLLGVWGVLAFTPNVDWPSMLELHADSPRHP